MNGNKFRIGQTTKHLVLEKL